MSELRDLLSFYGVADTDYVENLVDLARRSGERGWTQRVGIALPSYADYIDYEQTADYIRSFQPHPPGSLRIAWRSWWRFACGPEVMKAQLGALQELAEVVELQVLPLSAGAHAGVMGSFVLFSFPTPAFSDVVCVEHRTGTLYMETPEETDAYTLTFDSLRSAALSPTESLDMITRVKQEL